MQLIVDHVRQLDHIHDADRDALIERFAGTAVIQHLLAILGHAGFLHDLAELFVGDTVEYRGRELHAQLFGRIAQMDLQHLSDVHT